jgi:hypothetical protein
MGHRSCAPRKVKDSRFHRPSGGFARAANRAILTLLLVVALVAGCRTGQEPEPQPANGVENVGTLPTGEAGTT